MKLARILSKLDIGGHRPLKIRYEGIHTRENIRLRILFLSDLHIREGNAKQVVDHIVRSANSTDPHIILIGGDLVDNRSGLPALNNLIKTLRGFAPVFTVGGNHDRWVGTKCVRSCVTAAGGVWLNRHYTVFETSSGTPVIFEGPKCPVHNEKGYRILLAHQPDTFESTADKGIKLMLSGHLHGCQVVTHENNGRLYPGAWIYKWNGLRFTHNDSTLLVGRGVSDTIPMRWNCPREVLLCHLS